MKKADLANNMAVSMGMSKADAGKAVDLVFSNMASALAAGEEVVISGFGKFEVRTRAERNGVNPQTRKPIRIPKSYTVGFKPSKTLKDSF